MFQPGNYLGNVVKGVLGKSTNDKLQAAVQLEVTHVQVGGDWQEVDRAVRTVYLYFTGGAKEYSKKKLQALGFDNQFTDGDDGEKLMVFDKPDACNIYCKHEEYQGETKERWDISSGGGAGTGKPASDEDLMTFQALWAD